MPYTLNLVEGTTSADLAMLNNTGGFPSSFSNITVSYWTAGSAAASSRSLTIGARTLSIGWQGGFGFVTGGAFDSGHAEILAFAGDGMCVPSNWLCHVLVSIDTTTQTFQVAVNDVVADTSDAVWSSTNAISNPSTSHWEIDLQGPNAPTDNTGAFLGDVWMNDTFLDLTVTANRRKFINADLTPVDLGSTGQNPLSATPLAYFHCDGSTAASILTNLGSGGVWTNSSPTLSFQPQSAFVIAAGLQAPTGLTVAMGLTTAALAWTAPSGPVGSDYVVQYSSDGGVTWTPITGINTTSYTVTGLSSNTSYQFEVCWENECGFGPFSSIVTGVTAGPPLVWFRKNGGIWNGNASADPATGIGGIPLTALAGQAFYPTGQGTGDTTQTFNFGASAFGYTAPSGFVGCPHAGGGFTAFDPAKATGSANLAGGNLVLGTPTTAGMCQTLDGYTSGKYYYEVTLTSQDLFSNDAGAGIGKLFVGNGGSQSFWFEDGQFTTGNIHGGGVLIGGFFNTYVASAGAFGTAVVPSIFSYVEGDVLSVAFDLGGSPPPAITANVADFWFGSTAAFVDLSQSANRRKFIDASGCPVFLGANGQLPFNAAPAVFLTAAMGNAASFAANNGLGGTFTISGGSLALSSGGPCCSENVVENDNSPQGADPEVILSVSDDGGRTWSLLRKARSLGKIGQYLTRIRWLKMGQFRQRVIRLEITDPVKRRFVGFYADIKKGME